MSSDFNFKSKPPLGGWLPGVNFTPSQAETLNCIADEMIPGGEGFPAPSAVGIIGYFARYVTPTGQKAKWFPFFGEPEFKARLDAFGPGFAKTSSAERVEILKALEGDDADFFARLRDTIYLGYYSRPEVIHAINASHAAGRDYKTSPQPYGYSENMLDWDKTLLARVRGNYLRTEDVKPVSLEGLGL